MIVIKQHVLGATNHRDTRVVTSYEGKRLVMSRSLLPNRGSEAERLHYAVKCFCEKYGLDVPTIYGSDENQNYFWCHKEAVIDNIKEI